MIRVVKLGGSLLEASVLPACLDTVERFAGHTLLVPGGGVFAEQVRIAQRVYRFGDVAAHRMAILAMQQMALLFKGLRPDFRMVDTVENPSGRTGVAIWSPRVDELDKAGVPAGWDITSDSLAAWLAARVEADELILVKAAAVSAGASLIELQEQGIVDAAFTRFAARLACPVVVINKECFTSAT